MKVCSRCKAEYPISDYATDRSRKDGKHPYCRSCRREMSRRDWDKYRSERRRARGKWRDENRERFRAVCREDQRKLRERRRRAVVEHYSNGTCACACCGEQTYEFLAIDHIGGGGNKHRKEIKAGSGGEFYSWLIKHSFPSGFRVLCHNCNFAYGQSGSCPHQRSGAQEVA